MSSIFLNGNIAPLFNDFVLSGITKSTSIFCLNPKPLQYGHAPYGALNENILGSSSLNE